MSTAVIITAILCGSVVAIIALAELAVIFEKRAEKAAETAYWKGFADAIKMEKQESEQEQKGE